MSSIAFVRGKVVKQNMYQLFDCPKLLHPIPCENIRIVGLAWMIPDVRGGVLQGYDQSLQTDKPSDDSVRTIHIVDNASDTHYWIQVADDYTLSQFTELCNGCCGENPEITAPAVPEVDYSEVICPDAEGNYTFIFALPYNPNTLQITIGSSYFNGVLADTLDGVNYANAAAVLAGVQGDGTYSTKGTWTLINDSTQLKLVSTTVEKATVDMNLVPVSYCVNINSSTEVITGIKIDGVVTNFPAIDLADDGAIEALKDALDNVLIGEFDIATHTDYLQYTGLQLPEALTDEDDADAIAFTVGVCIETFNFAIPTLGGGEHLEISAASFNGEAETSQNGTDRATPAALLAAVQADSNFQITGRTWSLQSANTILRLVTSVDDTASVTIIATT